MIQRDKEKEFNNYYYHVCEYIETITDMSLHSEDEINIAKNFIHKTYLNDEFDIDKFEVSEYGYIGGEEDEDTNFLFLQEIENNLYSIHPKNQRVYLYELLFDIVKCLTFAGKNPLYKEKYHDEIENIIIKKRSKFFEDKEYIFKPKTLDDRINNFITVSIDELYRIIGQIISISFKFDIDLISNKFLVCNSGVPNNLNFTLAIDLYVKKFYLFELHENTTMFNNNDVLKSKIECGIISNSHFNEFIDECKLNNNTPKEYIIAKYNVDLDLIREVYSICFDYDVVKCDESEFIYCFINANFNNLLASEYVKTTKLRRFIYLMKNFFPKTWYKQIAQNANCSQSYFSKINIEDEFISDINKVIASYSSTKKLMVFV